MQSLHRRMLAAPLHSPSLLQDDLQAIQQRSAPLLLQTRPTALNRIVFAVVGRIVHQANLQTRSVRELNHPLQKLRPASRVVRAIVQVDHQPPDRWQAVLHQQPPHLEPIDPKITRLLGAEDDGQRSRRQHQNAKRRPFPLRRWIMIPAFRGLAIRAGSGFSPHERNRLRSPLLSYRRIFPGCPGL